MDPTAGYGLTTYKAQGRKQMRSILIPLSIAALATSAALLSTAGAQDRGMRTYAADREKGVAKKKTAMNKKATRSRSAKTRKTRVTARAPDRRARAARAPRVAGFARTRAGAKQPGGCGTYMYWKNGTCMDARNKK
jgi:hypothetical protein